MELLPLFARRDLRRLAEDNSAGESVHLPAAC